MFKKSLVLRVVWPPVIGIGTFIAAVIFCCRLPSTR